MILPLLSLILVASVIFNHRRAWCDIDQLAHELAPKYMRLDEYYHWIYADNHYLSDTPHKLMYRGKTDQLVHTINQILAINNTPALYDSVFANLFTPEIDNPNTIV